MTKIKLFVVIFITICVYHVCTGSVILRTKDETTPNPTTKIPNSINLTELRHADNDIIERLKNSMSFNETSLDFCGIAPCGWCSYNELEMTLDFMSNTCECRDQQRCERGRQDYSKSHYVYYCKHKVLNDDYDDSCISN